LFRRRNQDTPISVLETGAQSQLPRCRLRPARHEAHSGWACEDFAMSLLISVLITFVVIILVLYLVNILPIDGRAKQIVRVVVIIIGVLSLLRYLAVF
jgi:hypothetical protein